ncbi:MAG TPA: SRPBCC family protein, partial [Candidatus Eisenbacteria bacterium]|nr:SRPBCC family protein [Candidatus Eisenbacteria bacterium]
PAGVPFIDMSREFDAPVELLYRAYSEPELLKQWLGPHKYEMVIEEYDLRDGGRWRYVHRDTEGHEFGFHGVFHGPQSPDGMLQTFEFDGAPGHVSLDRLAFEERGGRTVVRTHSTFESVEDRDAMVEAGMAGGVNEGFDRLDDLLASMRVGAAAGA